MQTTTTTPAPLLQLFSTAHATLKRGISRGAYARNATGHQTGIHSSDAVAYDLPGALWLALAGRDDREAAFHEAWDCVREHAPRSCSTSPKVCAWLDDHTNATLLTLTATLAGLVEPSVPKAEPRTAELARMAKYLD